MRGEGGRPTKYKPKYCKMLIDHMAQGYSFESFAGLIKTSRQTIYTWTKDYRPFLDAKREGTQQAMLWWERMAMAGMAGKIKGFNSTVWVFSMKNRFGWRDKMSIDTEQEDSYEFTEDDGAQD